MDTTYWHKQHAGQPLFPELEWDIPERRDQAGKILIVGGHLHALGAPSKAFSVIRQLGPAAIELILPDSTKHLIGTSVPTAVFLPSTPSGELAISGKDELFSICHSADMLLLPGDTGRNSQTTQLLESAVTALTMPVVITKDSLDTLTEQGATLLGRSNTTFIASFAQLRKLVQKAGEITPLTYQMTLEQLAKSLHTVTEKYPANIAVFHSGQLIIASHGSISTTKITGDGMADFAWRTTFASLAACYQTWYSHKPFEALSHAAYLLRDMR